MVNWVRPQIFVLNLSAKTLGLNAAVEITIDVGFRFNFEWKLAFALQCLEGRFRNEVVLEILVLSAPVNPHVASSQPRRLASITKISK